jgi:hypothetical protein
VDSLVKHTYEAKGLGVSAVPAARNTAGRLVGAQGQGQGSSVADVKRADLERGMIATGIVPVELRGVAENLITRCVDTMREKGVEEGELYFNDFQSLGLEDVDEDKVKVLSTIPVVAVKDENRGGGGVGPGVNGEGTVKIRACARCGAKMEDAIVQRGSCAWMGNLQRTCFCGGFWVLLP